MEPALKLDVPADYSGSGPDICYEIYIHVLDVAHMQEDSHILIFYVGNDRALGLLYLCDKGTIDPQEPFAWVDFNEDGLLNSTLGDLPDHRREWVGVSCGPLFDIDIHVVPLLALDRAACFASGAVERRECGEELSI